MASLPRGLALDLDFDGDEGEGLPYYYAHVKPTPEGNTETSVHSPSAAPVPSAQVEKNQVTANGNAIWISLEKSTPNRHAAMKHLLDHIETVAGKGCTKIVTSASSFIVAVYDTVSNRDRDMKRIAKIEFKFKDKILPLQIAKFGDPGNSGPYVFHPPIAPALQISSAPSQPLTDPTPQASPAFSHPSTEYDGELLDKICPADLVRLPCQFDECTTPAPYLSWQ